MKRATSAPVRATFAIALAAIALHARSAIAAPPWVDRPLTLPAGDFAFDFGLGIGHVPAGPDDNTAVGVNAEMSVGLTSRIELGVRTGVRFGDGFEHAIDPDAYGRMFDRQTFDEGADTFGNPEVRVRGAIVRGPVAEVSLEGRVVIPFADDTGAGVMFGVPMAFHIGDRVRLDVGVYSPVIFPPREDASFSIRAPLDVWIQATSRFWIGPMTGLAFENVAGLAFDDAGRPRGNTEQTEFSLGVGLGYAITHAIDFKAQFLFPELNLDSRVFGFGAGVELRIE
jgi:hypothetical protein